MKIRQDLLHQKNIYPAVIHFSLFLLEWGKDNNKHKEVVALYLLNRDVDLLHYKKTDQYYKQQDNMRHVFTIIITTYSSYSFRMPETSAKSMLRKDGRGHANRVSLRPIFTPIGCLKEDNDARGLYCGREA